jgi:Fe-Mn family superoxide dismutase
MKFELPKLNYSFSALEPYIDKKTMEVHFLKHHQGYIDKLNLIVGKDTSLSGVTAEYMLTHLKTVNPEIRDGVANFAGGHVNHSFFWQIMTPEKTSPGEKTVKIINDRWLSLEQFAEEFIKKALGVFGSGWTWLSVLNNQFEIMSTANQNSPLSLGQTPLLGVDVWEHAYYLKYQNRREEYLRAWWNVIDWKMVESHITDIERGPP